MKMELGKVYLVGAGPGNPELMTLKALNILKKAEVILYDALLDPSFLEYFPSSAIVHYVGKRAGQHSATQQEIIDLLVRYAEEGRTVVRLKGGDPFVFGRGGEELLVLRERKIPYEIVPGVSALSAGSSGAGFPLTHRGLSRQVLIMDGHTVLKEDTDWKWFAEFKGTIALFMGTSSIGQIAKNLIDHGASSFLPVALVENASLKTQKTTVTNLGKISEEGLSKQSSGPGIIYIGPVVNLIGETPEFSEQGFLSQGEEV
ncbi:uroporphyrinogen-III C-methyltransferase [Leptospira sarikeiensis]|uniref:uroporphyrinogen-III C-methyltransferase n=1 Tax=Leptospira sarikeiensis TaxID=2484943 RepID=A0A4R9KCQ6_9LEPT|nr:uroporphyrinogen-III C-methyltransferase [Leptospira sarikeiensis]TGL62921.1 uroporphyrinogen-III C-methyltransferase [Leptospira sarikeiensis]